MSKINNLKKEVPSPEHTFLVDAVGEVTKKRYVGEFTCRIPRKKEQCLIDKHRAFLNGPQADQLEPDTLKFHHMISYLRYTLQTDKAPTWWKESDLGYEMYDQTVVENIYDEVLKFEVDWLKEIWGEEAVNKLKAGEQGGEQTPAEEKSA